MRHVGYAVLIALITICFTAVVVVAEDLPESVKKQSRKDAKENKDWEKFDQSGPVKFLQVQDTAAASEKGTGEKLDGSIGERLVEIKTTPDVSCEKVSWTLENKGSSPAWVVAGADEVIAIDAEASATLENPLVEGYTYIVVDNEGGGETELNISATCGETEAKTARGKSMQVVWF